MFAPSYPRQEMFQALDRCIYCGHSGELSELTKEHVVPLGIAGHWMVLDHASCSRCAQITSGIERAVLKDALGILREKFGSPTRHQSERTGISRRTLAKRDDHGTWVGTGTLDIPVAELPAVCMLPEMNAPRMFAPLEADPGWTGSFWLWQEEVSVPLPAASSAQGASIHIGKLNPAVFARFLAKIAHGYAVARMGIDGFTPFLRDVILDKFSDPFVYVGGITEPPPSDTSLHTIEHGFFAVEGGRLVAVRIRLFAYLGAPEYVVVVGTVNT